MWEAVIDHLHCMRCELDGSPSLFQNLYEAVDDYRTERGVDSTNAINLLIDVLSNPDNQNQRPNILISKLYEELSGEELMCETDQENGEDYEYKHNPRSLKTSIALHPEVIEFFGFKNQYLKVNGKALLLQDLKNWQIGNIFRNNTYSLLR